MSFISNLSWRYAAKSFDASKPVSAENIAAIQNAIRMAPTSYGLQPFHVTVVSDAGLKAKLMEKAYNQAQVGNCSHLFVLSSRSDSLARVDSLIDLIAGGDESKKGGLKVYEDMMKGSISPRSEQDIVEWAARQSYIALGFALAACAELQIDSCPMEGFDNAAFKAELGLDDVLNPVVILPVGYRAESESPRPKTRFSNEDLFDIR